MGESSGQLGGYLVPTDFSLKIMRAISEESFILRGERRPDGSSSEILLPRVSVEVAADATGTSALFGG